MRLRVNLSVKVVVIPTFHEIEVEIMFIKIFLDYL